MMGKYFQIIAVSCFVLTEGCSSDFHYNYQVANYGVYGVTFLKFPNTRLPPRVEPGTPGVRDDIHFKTSAFYNDHKVIPQGQHEIIWQLNKLSDCKLVRGPYESYDPMYPGMYTSKGLCTWTPIPGKIFRKTIDIHKIAMSNKHAERAGKKDEGFFSMSGRRVMTITFVFIDGKLDMKIGTFISNPWAKNDKKNKSIYVAMSTIK